MQTQHTKPARGLKRVINAWGYSIQGLRAGLSEPAFLEETLLACIMIPAAFWLGQTWLEVSLLVAVVVLVLVTELLNTGIEAAIDRISLDHHPLSKRAKDVGSAAVMLALLLCGGIWAAALFNRFA
jgi:diacylglycerol kinase (ATP)